MDKSNNKIVIVINQIVIFSIAGTLMLLHVAPGLQSHHNEVGTHTTGMHFEYTGNLIFFIFFFSILLLLRCDITDDNPYYVNGNSYKLLSYRNVFSLPGTMATAALKISTV